MKPYLFILLSLFLSISSFAVDNQLPQNDTYLGQKSASSTAKRIIFQNGKGVSNTQIISNPIQNDFTVSSTAVKIKAPTISVGTGAASGSPQIKFDTGAVSQPTIRYNNSTSKVEFSNDGTNYKGIGSGSGGGGGGLQLLENPDFEANVTTGWSTSGTPVVTNPSYSIGTTDNQKYASVSATVIGQSYDSTPKQVTDILNGQDCEFNASYQATGSWRVDVLSSGTVIASQTLTAASNWGPAPKIFYPCGALGTTLTQVKFVNLSLGVLSIDDVYLGSIRSLKNGAINTTWISYTNGCSGSWGNVTYTCKTKQLGDTIKAQVKISLAAGAPTGTNLTLNLPNGHVIDTNKLASSVNLGSYIKGSGSILDNGTRVYEAKTAYVNSTSISVQVLGQTVTNIDYAGPVTPTIPMTFTTGDSVDVEFEFPAVGISGSSTTFDSRCPNDISCTNEFSAFIGANGAVSGENQDWIASCTNANPTVCTLNTGVFSVVPVCTAAIDNLAGEATVTTISPTSIGITTYNSAGSTSTLAKVVRCSKQGVDFVAKKEVEGFLNKTMTHSGDAIKREAWATFGGAGSMSAPTACTASPCTKYEGDSAITGSTRSAAGTYDVGIAAGTFTKIESIQVTQSTNINNSAKCSWVTATPTSIIVGCHNATSSAAQDNPFSITVKGTR